MARINIDIGVLGNPATGDTLRTAMSKINTNFAEVYSLVRDGSSGLIATDVTNGDLKIQANGTGNIEIDQLSINGDSITSIATNGSVDITGNGTGGVNIEALSFNGTSISSTDSSRINLNENVTVDGDLNVTGSISGTFTVSSLDADSSTVSNLEVDNFKASAIVIESEGISSNDNDTTLPTSAAVKDYVDTNSVTASETATFTNKTFDANGSGNSISNIEVADFAAASIVTEAEGIGNNDNDTTIPTSAAVKDYVDARDIGDLSVTGSTISAPSNADLTLTTSGTGSVSIDGIQISGTELSSSDSTQITIKENLHVTGNISGTITGTVSTLDADNTTVSNLEVDNFKAATIVTEAEGIGSNDNDTTIPTSAAVKDYVDNNAGGTTGDLAITGSTISAPSNADLTLTTSGTGSVSVDGIQIKGTEISSTDSTQVTIKENLHVTGNITGSIDADNSTISNLEVDNFKAATIVTEGEGIGSNDNDTTIPTSAAVKDYVDSNPTTSLAADNLTTGDASVTITTTTGDITLDTQESNRDIIFKGTDGGVDITPLQLDMSEGGKAIFSGVTIADNTISSRSSNADLELNASGTGTVVLENLKVGTGGSTVTTILDEDNMATNSATALATQQSIKAYVDSEISGVSGGSTGDLTISGSTISAPSNADLTLNAGGTGSVDIDGIQIKGTSISSTDSTQININENVSIDGTLNVGGSALSGTLDIAGNTGTGTVALASQSLLVTGTTNEINVDAAGFALTMSLADNITGIVSVTASGFLSNGAVKIEDNKISTIRSNDDLQMEAAGTGNLVANSPFTFNAGYIEKINTLTSSSTITVNCALASIHTVTLGTSTEFNITNLPTGGTVTLIITQDGSGSRAATFGTDGSTAVKFPGGSPTLSTGAGDIDVVTIVNDGTNFLGNCAKDYS